MQYREHPAALPKEVPPLVEGPDHLPQWEARSSGG
jgi:hypothetical protein